MKGRPLFHEKLREAAHKINVCADDLSIDRSWNLREVEHHTLRDLRAAKVQLASVIDALTAKVNHRDNDQRCECGDCVSRATTGGNKSW